MIFTSQGKRDGKHAYQELRVIKNLFSGDENY